MKEYYGKSADLFYQKPNKFYSLFPVLKQRIGMTHYSKLIDLGCGKGDLIDILNINSNAYIGLDISSSMLELATIKYPNFQYIQLDVAKKLEKINPILLDSDIVLANMLFVCLNSKNKFINTFKNAYNMLKNNGRFIIGTIHPCFDNYMLKYFINKPNVKTKFNSYYETAAEYISNTHQDQYSFTFQDYHWTLDDYIQTGFNNNFQLTYLNECRFRPSNSLNQSFIKKYSDYPRYLVLEFTKL